jgi:two-component system sensor histidine kinase QseC
MQPVRTLTGHLTDASLDLGTLRRINPLPNSLLEYGHSFFGKTDEFTTLLKVIEGLIDRINLNHRLTRAWTFQMAHELKTPLALAKISLEEIGNTTINRSIEVTSDNSPLIAAEKQLDRMSKTISQFLGWVETENTNAPQNLHALRLCDLITDAVARVSVPQRTRIALDLNTSESVFSDPLHAEQLLDNAISNALKHSPQNSIVKISAFDTQLKISDDGPGIPDDVLARLGEPFNTGPVKLINGERNSGLGLAWMVTIGRINDWKIDFKSGSNGTEISINFASTHVKPDLKEDFS